jgi:hypothetical protein|tara:strand:- start:430 stop:642 length:213 start_codon:yes stop_codon:yes gene_type:complete
MAAVVEWRRLQTVELVVGVEVLEVLELKVVPQVIPTVLRASHMLLDIWTAVKFLLLEEEAAQVQTILVET